jgi:hypothetical protein
MPIVEVLFEPQLGLHEVSDVMVITADGSGTPGESLASARNP